MLHQTVGDLLTLLVLHGEKVPGDNVNGIIDNPLATFNRTLQSAISRSLNFFILQGDLAS
jgi:hypothetical protein